MFREMRRKNQRLTAEECGEILARATSGILAVHGDDGYPYAVPLSYVYTDGKFLFHCAGEGHKLDAVRNNEKASFCVIGRDEVIPAQYATDYRSVIAFGRVRILPAAEAAAAITKLAIKYAPDNEKGRKAEIARAAGRYVMLEMAVAHMTGKRALVSTGTDRTTP